MCSPGQRRLVFYLAATMAIIRASFSATNYAGRLRITAHKRIRPPAGFDGRLRWERDQRRLSLHRPPFADNTNRQHGMVVNPKSPRSRAREKDIEFGGENQERQTDRVPRQAHWRSPVFPQPGWSSPRTNQTLCPVRRQQRLRAYPRPER